ncbi:hypothetical protein E1265_00215 [Streptomyces sp. 8K308]|uniref:DUF6328 family protein n=1 Tax=Streptomyces sp. 8K308 TaxID=2530388 RepID=UPI00104CD8AB|nr:DUF6328 family protein [Streptomyces sp. 8K308]TDC28001.1 hypothetical protein E1265_00215 [Streptomyces sp. 8K308]
MPRAQARHETPMERADRNFTELLQELRVTQTGVQILFAFLLTLAFTQRFEELDDFARGTYVTTLVFALSATALFTAPAAVHRGLFQRGAKRLIVTVSSRLAAAGLVMLALTFTGSLLLVVDVVVGRTAGIVAGSGAFLLCLALWWVLPRLLRRRVEPGRR